MPDPGDMPMPELRLEPVRYWSGSDPGDVVEGSLLGCPTTGGPMGLGIIGDPGALFDLS